MYLIETYFGKPSLSFDSDVLISHTITIDRLGIEWPLSLLRAHQLLGSRLSLWSAVHGKISEMEGRSNFQEVYTMPFLPHFLNRFRVWLLNGDIKYKTLQWLGLESIYVIIRLLQAGSMFLGQVMGSGYGVDTWRNPGHIQSKRFVLSKILHSVAEV